MSIEEIIKAKGEERVDAKLSKNEAFKQESIAIRDNIIKTYGKRVGKILKVMRMIRDNDPELWKKIRPERFVNYINKSEGPNYFFTDGWEHSLGFYTNLDAIGQMAGGACGNVNLIVTENDCRFEMRGIEEDRYINFWSRECAKKFAEKFEQFEDRFRKFVDDNYGKGTYDMEE